ncbi:MAG: ABC transporter permease [Actinomycetota bacterium]|nr:ABC transporter permease [Actinomycetota bacterium]
MVGYLIRRVIQAVIVIVGVIIICFILFHIYPGGSRAEARAVLGQRATGAAITNFLQVEGLSKPLWQQFFLLIAHAFSGNLGYSFKQGQPVWTIISERLPRTVILVGLSVIFAVLVAIPLGIFQVLRRNKPADYALTGLSFVGYATPTFFLGIVLIQLLAITWHLFPAEAPQQSGLLAILGDWKALVLPVVTLATVTIAGFSRYMRSSMMEALTEDYVRTARAKGAANRRVIFVHALRNALIPIVTLLGLSLPAIVSGAVITENVFNYPGMGLLFVTSASNNDFPLIIATTLVAGVATVIGSLLADILYAVLDPRIRYVSK